MYQVIVIGLVVLKYDFMMYRLMQTFRRSCACVRQIRVADSTLIVSHSASVKIVLSPRKHGQCRCSKNRAFAA